MDIQIAYSKRWYQDAHTASEITGLHIVTSCLKVSTETKERSNLAILGVANVIFDREVLGSAWRKAHTDTGPSLEFPINTRLMRDTNLQTKLLMHHPVEEVEWNAQFRSLPTEGGRHTFRIAATLVTTNLAGDTIGIGLMNEVSGDLEAVPERPERQN
jgi:hypothetical protein